MSITRKVKRGAQKPPLSGLDKAIYVFLILLSMGLLVAALLIYLYILDYIAFSDESIVAKEATLGMIFAIPLVMFIGMFPMITFAYGYKAKQPIFGNKRFRTPAFAPLLKTYPILSKEFRQNLTDENKAKIRKNTKSILVIFFVCVLLFTFGIYPRKVLDKDNNFTSYNSFNKKIHSYNIEEADNLVIRIHRHRRGAGYSIEMDFEFDGQKYNVGQGSFNNMSREETLEYMVYLKSFFDESEYEITNIKRMDDLLYYNDFTNVERELVYEVLDYK